MKTEYAMVLYFDDETNRTVQTVMDEIAVSTGNKYMIDNSIPPHITIGDFFTEEDVTDKLEVLSQALHSGKILFNELETFSPYVLYIKPVMNKYLITMNAEANKIIDNIGYEVNKLYSGSNWISHLTIATKLKYQQLEKASLIANRKFKSFYGYAKRVALVRCNPYREIKSWILQDI